MLESFPDNEILDPKSTGLFGPGKTLCKILSRQPRELKLVGVIACIMFYKVSRSEILVITNDVIMTSLLKQ